MALSHGSGALAHGIGTWGVDLSRVHVHASTATRGRVEGDVVDHEGFCIEEDVMEVDGLRVCDLSAVPSKRRASRPEARGDLRLTPAQEALDHDGLMRRLEQMSRGRAPDICTSPSGWRTVGLRVLASTAVAGCAGASSSRYRGPVRGVRRSGVLRGTTDWWWPEYGLLGEFDGRIKYGRLLKPGQDPGEVVFAEKNREDILREISGCRMIRLIWSDYERPRLTASRIKDLLRRAS